MELPLGVQKLVDAFFAALYRRELDQCRSILAELDAICPKDSAGRSWFDYLTGILAFRHNNSAAAKRIFTELLDSPELDLLLQGRLLIALGRVYDYEGNLSAAVASHKQSLSIFERLDLPIEQVKAWKIIASCYQQGFTQGDFGADVLEQAIQCCYNALDILETQEVTPENQRFETMIWNCLGLIHRDLGNWDQAIACHERDLAICTSLADRFGIGLAYGNLGEIHYLRGPDGRSTALAYYQEALTIIREFNDRYEEIEALTNLAFLHQQWNESRVALDYYGQAIALIEILRTEATSEQSRAGFFATIANTYANTVLLCLEAGHKEQAFDYVERARSRAFLDVLTARSPELSREMAATPMTLAEVQAALPADALLIEYFTSGLIEARDDRSASHQASHRHRFPPARTLIFAVTRDGIQAHDASISPNDLLPRQLDSVVERHFLQPQIRRALYDGLIAPVEELLRGRRRLYLVPHGPLHYIPFQALIAPDGETLLRAEGPQLVYAPSASILFRRQREEPGQAPVACLALGYNGVGTTRLRFAEEEARNVARQTDGRVLAGPSPKKAALYRQAANYQVLHFSCHGEFDPYAPLASALHLAPGETLTALDVLEHLRLRCDLVTLSACESGLSRVRRGDELVGLMRAFMHAGAPALVSTLWRVDEISTLILMVKFYRQVRTGMDFAEALKQAQLYLKNLTRKEALDVLARFPVDKTLDSAIPLGESRSELPVLAVTLEQAGAYLKGLAIQDGRDSAGMLLSGKDDDRVFAAPYYWAPFVLVGDHGSVTLAGEDRIKREA